PAPPCRSPTPIAPTPRRWSSHAARVAWPRHPGRRTTGGLWRSTSAAGSIPSAAPSIGGCGPMPRSSGGSIPDGPDSRVRCPSPGIWSSIVTNKLKVVYLKGAGPSSALQQLHYRGFHLATNPKINFKLLLSTSNRLFGVLMSSSVPGSARLVLASDVRHLNEPQAVFSAMLTGWQRQLRSRSLSNQTVDGRISLIRRFNEFAGSYPCAWPPGDMEDLTLALMSGPKRAAPSTIQGYHLIIRMFCDYLLYRRYGWVEECQKRLDQFPSQVCHDYNPVAHMPDYEGHPER